MNIRNSTALFALSAGMCLVACEDRNGTSAVKETAPTTVRNDAAKPTAAADNTVRNKVDGGGDTKTPMDQSESAAHIKITADIRRAIADDKVMSTNAQNCKIITDKSGRVTLRGVVDSQAEKDSIDAKARAVAGASNVDNQLEVKSS